MSHTVTQIEAVVQAAVPFDTAFGATITILISVDVAGALLASFSVAADVCSPLVAGAICSVILAISSTDAFGANSFKL
jgi:hypothetical protein